MVGDMWWPECVKPPLPKEKSPLAAEIKSLFGDSCLTKICLFKIYFLLVELALAERDFKNAGLSFLSIFFSVVPKW